MPAASITENGSVRICEMQRKHIPNAQNQTSEVQAQKSKYEGFVQGQLLFPFSGVPYLIVFIRETRLLFQSSSHSHIYCH